MIHLTFSYAQQVIHFDNAGEARKLSLKLIPAQAIACALDLIAAAGGIISLAATGGVEPEIIAFTCRRHAMGVKIFAFPFVDLLRAINPQARFSFEPQQENVLVEEEKFLSTSPAERVFIYLDPYIEEYKKEDHLTPARLLYVALTIGTVLIRLIETLISCVAVPMALLSGGKWETVNTIAFCTLQALPNGIFELAGGLIKVINPRSQLQNSGARKKR